jgi:3-phosphoglycerate kinase
MVDEVVNATKKGAVSVAGGGDTVSLLKKVKGASE